MYGVRAAVWCMCCRTDSSEMKTACNAHLCTIKMNMKMSYPQRLILEDTKSIFRIFLPLRFFSYYSLYSMINLKRGQRSAA